MKHRRSAYERDYLAWYRGRSLRHAHQASFGNRASVEVSTRCGCYHCLRIFHPAHIRTWTLERSGRQTAWCPFCGIDSLLADATGFPITPHFLQRLSRAYFGQGHKKGFEISTPTTSRQPHLLRR